MKQYFIVKIKYERTAEEGKIVRVNEVYLVDALSFEECEKRIVEEMKPFISGEFEVVSITRYRLAELFLGEGESYFRAKVSFITLDEEKGIERKTSVFMLVQADNVKEAESSLTEGMKGSLADYRVESITETKIIDIFQYETEK